MTRRSRAQAAETQQPAAVDGEQGTDQPAPEPAPEPAELEARDIDFERYVNDLNAFRDGGCKGPRPVAHAVAPVEG